MKLLCTLQHYDTQAFLKLAAINLNTTLGQIFRQISKTGDGPSYLLIWLGVALQAGVQHQFVQTALLAFLMERPLYFMLKNGFKRNRPQDALTHFTSVIVPHDQFSFPSGHTSAAFLMATLGGVFWPMLTIPLYIWATCVGFSRVLLGVHFPGDVAVGAVMGTGIAYLSVQWVQL